MTNLGNGAKDNEDFNDNNNGRDVLSDLMNPDVVVILSELVQDGEEKYIAYISKNLDLSAQEIENRISTLVNNSIVTKCYDGDGYPKLRLDKEKLDNIVGNDENFTAIEDGLAKLDQYLN